MKKMNTVQTKDLVADAIRNEILSGHMQAGDELAQEVLAEMLGVSRMPVREALQLLEQEGYIERLPNRHMVVAELNADKIMRILYIAAAMETEIIIQGQGIESTIPGDLLVCMMNHLEKGDVGKAAEYELEYHLALVQLLEITYIAQLFGKFLGGYISYMIQEQAVDLVSRCHHLRNLDNKRQQGSRAELNFVLQSYYEELFSSWNGKTENGVEGL